MRALEEIFPLFGLRIAAGPLRFSAITDEELPALVELVGRGIHDPSWMPFTFPWTDAPAADLPRLIAQYHWRARADFTPANWQIDLVVRFEDELVGVQGISTHDYLVTRTGETGSWLGVDHQGRGIGTEMRKVLCGFMFNHLDAAEVTSAAFADNAASLAVSRKVGYRPNGLVRMTRRQAEPATLERLVLTPTDLVRSAHEVRVEGLAGFRELVGLPALPTP